METIENKYKIFELREGLLKEPKIKVPLGSPKEKRFDTSGYNSKKEALRAILKSEGRLKKSIKMEITITFLKGLVKFESSDGKIESDSLLAYSIAKLLFDSAIDTKQKMIKDNRILYLTFKKIKIKR